MNGENKNNNNQNEFNFNQSINDDAFNVFNQNAESFQKHLEEQRQAEAANKPATPPTPPVPTQINNVKTVEPKINTQNKKKENQKFDINNLDTLPDPKKNQKTEEQKAQEKKKKTLIGLIVLIVVLVVVLLWAINVISNIALNSSDIKNSVTTEISNHIHEELTNQNKEKKNFTKECSQNLSNFKNYNFPEENSIKYELSTANISYYGNEEKLIKATQKIELKYSYIDEYAMAKIKNYCNAYNKIEDSYQLQCTFENNILTLNNNFFIQKLDTNIISTNNITIELYGNKSTNIEEIINQEIASGNICKEV